MELRGAIAEIEELIGSQELEDFLEYLRDEETIWSARVDLLAELALIELRGLDPIVALGDVEGLLFYYDSPLLKYEASHGAVNTARRRALAKVAQLHLRNRVRAEWSQPALTEFEAERWLVRPARPSLPSHPPYYIMPMPYPPRSVKTAIQHSDEFLREIADMVRRTYPEEVAYVRAARKEDEIGRGGWGVGWLRSIDGRIYQVERFLAPPKGPHDWWLQSHLVKDLLISDDRAEG